MDAEMIQIFPGEDTVVVQMTPEEAASIADALSFGPTADLIRQTSYWEDVEALVRSLESMEG